LDAIAFVMKFSSSVELMSSDLCMPYFTLMIQKTFYCTMSYIFFLAGWTTKTEVLSFDCTRWSCS
jgi:hypothetical protein